MRTFCTNGLTDGPYMDIPPEIYGPWEPTIGYLRTSHIFDWPEQQQPELHIFIYNRYCSNLFCCCFMSWVLQQEDNEWIDWTSAVPDPVWLMRHCLVCNQLMWLEECKEAIMIEFFVYDRLLGDFKIKRRTLECQMHVRCHILYNQRRCGAWGSYLDWCHLWQVDNLEQDNFLERSTLIVQASRYQHGCPRIRVTFV